MSGGAFAPESRGAFGGFIGPRNLVALVESAAPFLFDGTHPDTARMPATSGARLSEHAGHPLGWWSLLRRAELVPSTGQPTPAERTDYFALCLAAHWASVATYVPTDVDSKIRHALWFEDDPHEELERRRDLALALEAWEVEPVSARSVVVEGAGRVSGHDGERLSVLCGGALGFLARGDDANAARLEERIDAELAREARAFEVAVRSGDGPAFLCSLATILTHNAGDVMQALDAPRARKTGPRLRERFADLARSSERRYGGAFARAAAVYRELLAAEGHRNYPLRETKLLRASRELLLPLGPFLDDWGARLARWEPWGDAQRAEVVSALVQGCRRIPGQAGYARALAGFDAAARGGLASRELALHYTTAVRKQLEDSELRKQLAVRRASFESSYAKRAQAILARVSP